MGSVAISSLIVFASFFLSLTIVYSAVMDTQYEINRAREIREEMVKNYYDSSVEVISANSTSAGLNITLKNDGKVVLNPYYLTVLVDGNCVNITNVDVEGTPTTVWAPGEYLNITVDYYGNFSRIKIVTEYGNFAYYVR